MTETKQWVVVNDQWNQDFWTFENGQMIHYENDNKENYSNTSTITIQKFIAFYSDRNDAPYPEIILFLKQL